MDLSDIVIKKCRENVGGETPSRFDYQIALALSYLLSSFGQDCTILLESLEDFAVIKGVKSGSPSVDVYQVKTRENGLMDKSTLLAENVYGKIYLTDYFISKKSTTLNIICNANLKGNSTEHLQSFLPFLTLSKEEKQQIEDNISAYFSLNLIGDFVLTDQDKGKLVYIKTDLPFPGEFNAPLLSKVNEMINGKEENGHTINPQCIVDSLIDLCEKKRKPLLKPNSTLEGAIKEKGVSSEEISRIIEDQRKSASVGFNEIIKGANDYHIAADDINKMKNDYSSFVSKNNCFSDNLFHVFLNSIRVYMDKYAKVNNTVTNEIVVKAAYKEFSGRKETVYSEGVIWLTCIWVSLTR